MTNSLSAERLYALLPAVHRLRDAAHGEPLRALLAAFAQEFAGLEENLAQLYDDQFIETCAEWVAPYIGDLIGYRPLHGVVPNVASPRAEVANTIAYRRRKGTALVLEQLAGDVTGWPAHAVEFFEQLATTQYVKHPRRHAKATADLRDLRALVQHGGAFNALARTVEVRRPESRAGRYSIPSIGIFLWRLQALRSTAVPLVADPGDASGRKFRVNPLGADLRLFRRAQAEADISHLAQPINVPEPLSVRLMALSVRKAQTATPEVNAKLGDDYGEGKSLVLVGPDSKPISLARIRVCDLRDILAPDGTTVSGWNHQGALPAEAIGVDPERGRVLLGAAVEGPLSATFHYGSASSIGGGEYDRTPAGSELPLQLSVVQPAPLQPQLHAVAGGGRLSIGGSGSYAETPAFEVDAAAPGKLGVEVVVAAAHQARPLLASAGEMSLLIGARGRLVLDGLMISGGALRLPAAADAEPRELVLRDCTLVPGLALHPDGSAVSPGAPSLIIEHPFAKLTLERCITGPLWVVAGADVRLRDCIVDAGAPDSVAYAAGVTGGPGAELRVEECTWIGKLHTQLFRLGSNSIFLARLGGAATETWPAPLLAERRQEGCVRFSYVPPGSIAPRCHRCVPDAAQPELLPYFASLRYGDAAYCQLHPATDRSILSGAYEDGEMGVLHALFQPQREVNLRVRLEEYLRFGLRAGIFYAS